MLKLNVFTSITGLVLAFIFYIIFRNETSQFNFEIILNNSIEKVYKVFLNPRSFLLINKNIKKIELLNKNTKGKSTKLSFIIEKQFPHIGVQELLCLSKSKPFFIIFLCSGIRNFLSLKVNLEMIKDPNNKTFVKNFCQITSPWIVNGFFTKFLNESHRNMFGLVDYVINTT